MTPRPGNELFQSQVDKTRDPGIIEASYLASGHIELNFRSFRVGNDSLFMVDIPDEDGSGFIGYPCDFHEEMDANRCRTEPIHIDQSGNPKFIYLRSAEQAQGAGQKIFLGY